jgi:hypothetical protein
MGENHTHPLLTAEPHTKALPYAESEASAAPKVRVASRPAALTENCSPSLYFPTVRVLRYSSIGKCRGLMSVSGRRPGPHGTGMVRCGLAGDIRRYSEYGWGFRGDEDGCEAVGTQTKHLLRYTCSCVIVSIATWSESRKRRM